MQDKPKYNKYSEYKDSGVDWLGKVPMKWDLVKLKYVFYEKKHTHNPNLSSGSISFGEVVFKDDEKIPERTKQSYQEVLKGEFLINPLNLNYDLISLRIGLSNIDVVVSTGYIVLKNNLKICKKYYKYLLHRYDVAYMKLLGSGVRQTINFNHISNSLLVFPPLSEQTAIALFLDDKTTKIDKAISNKQKLIKLLKERKQIIIQDLVTGKKVWDEQSQSWIKPTKTKNSGVEWIGEIPEEWEVKPGMSYLKENKRNNKGMKENVVLSLSYGNIIIKPKEKLVGLVPESFETYQIVYPNDIIVRCTDLQNDQTSLRTGLSKEKGIITSAYLNLGIKDNHLPEYIHAYLHFIDTTKVIYKYGSGLRQNLNFPDFKRMPFLDLTSNEQFKIVDYINLISKRIIDSISIQERQIEKLKEYKSVLIDSAVTGKIRVC
ncbi:MAG: restriction endonuclease subunit S [Bacteroidales bacterium]|nr:restriction endonuclease subunit S [Bacteroidales bacterium]